MPDEEKHLLIKALTAELNKEDALKHALLAELRQQGKLKLLSHNPAVVVFLGFVLTGLFGTGLSLWLQSREWDRQQELLAKQRSLEQRIQLATEITKAIGEIQNSMMSVLGAMQKDKDYTCLEQLKKAEPDWQKAKFQWGVSASVLGSQLNASFHNSDAGQTAAAKFQEIVQCYRSLNIGLTNMAEVVNATSGRRSADIRTDITKLITTLNTGVNGTMTPGLVKLIQEQLRLDPETKPSPSPSDPQSSNDTQLSQVSPPCEFSPRTYPINASKKVRKRHRNKVRVTRS